MKINDIIRTRRQTLGMTQEALADQLGVSASAVNKWERALNYPDITLLPALARTLGVDLNTLLSFQEDISREEIALFLNELAETAKEKGCSGAFQLARNKLWEFPNNDLLAFNTAGMLAGLFALYPAGTEDERRDWEREIEELYERSIHSIDPQIREWAAYMVAARCIGKGELARAETLLEQVPDTCQNKSIVLASLREKQGRCEEAWGLLEKELFLHANGIQSVLLSMIDLALADGDLHSARIFANRAAAAGKALELFDYTVLTAPFQVAIAERDGAGALTLLEKMLHSLTAPWDMNASPLYRHLAAKQGTESQSLLLRYLIDAIETDPKSRFLKEVPGYQALMEKFRAWSVTQ